MAVYCPPNQLQTILVVKVGLEVCKFWISKLFAPAIVATFAVRQSLGPAFWGCLRSNHSSVSRDPIMRLVSLIALQCLFPTCSLEVLFFIKQTPGWSHSVAQAGRAEKLRPVLAMVHEREELRLKMVAFERSASDKSRLYARGNKLLEEEKFRKHVAVYYPKLMAKLQRAIAAWEEMEGADFVYHGVDYKTTLEVGHRMMTSFSLLQLLPECET